MVSTNALLIRELHSDEPPVAPALPLEWAEAAVRPQRLEPSGTDNGRGLPDKALKTARSPTC